VFSLSSLFIHPGNKRSQSISVLLYFVVLQHVAQWCCSQSKDNGNAEVINLYKMMFVYGFFLLSVLLD
jgi:hypothetical protein